MASAIRYCVTDPQRPPGGALDISLRSGKSLDGLADGAVLNSRRSIASQSWIARWSAGSTSTRSVGAWPVRRLVVRTAASKFGAKIVNSRIWRLHDVNLKRKIHGRLAAPSGGPGNLAGPVVATDANGPMQDQAPMSSTPATAAPVRVRWLRWCLPCMAGANLASLAPINGVPGVSRLAPLELRSTGAW